MILRRGLLTQTPMSTMADVRIGDLEAGEGEPLYENDAPPVHLAYALRSVPLRN